MEKRGISQIITAVLIILLVLASVLLLWQAVRSIIETETQEISVEQLSYSAEIESFKVNSAQDLARVTIRRNSGGGEISEVKLIFYDTNSMTYSYEDATKIPDELETETYDIAASDLGITNFQNIQRVEVHFIFKESGVEKASLSLDKEDKAVSSVSGWCNDGATQSCVPASPNPCKEYEQTCSGGIWQDCTEIRNRPDGDSCETDGECHSGECLHIPQEYLRAYWKFEDDFGDGETDDSSTNNYIATIDGAQQIDDAKRGKVASFDGIDDTIYPDADSVMNMANSPLTYSAWINTSHDGIIIERGATARGVQLAVRNGKAEFVYRWSFAGFSKITGSTDVNDSEWHHIVATINSTGDMVLYIDSIKENELLDTASLMTGEPPQGLSIGSHVSNTGSLAVLFPPVWFNGSIDDVMVYNSPLTLENVSAIYNIQKD